MGTEREIDRIGATPVALCTRAELDVIMVELRRVVSGHAPEEAIPVGVLLGLAPIEPPPH